MALQRPSAKAAIGCNELVYELGTTCSIL